MRDCCHPDQNRRTATQKSLSSHAICSLQRRMLLNSSIHGYVVSHYGPWLPSPDSRALYIASAILFLLRRETKAKTVRGFAKVQAPSHAGRTTVMIQETSP